MVSNASIMECDDDKSTVDKWFMVASEDHSAEANQKPGEP
jgi:hypothetical protein